MPRWPNGADGERRAAVGAARSWLARVEVARIRHQAALAIALLGGLTAPAVGAVGAADAGAVLASPPQAQTPAPAPAPASGKKNATAGDPTQQPSPTARPPRFVRFRTPDGSRFILLPRPGQGHVHWIVATPADASVDPPGLRGLASAVQRASLGGTWEIGSRDPERERAMVAELARAQDELLGHPGSPELVQQVQSLERQVAELGDPRVFSRVLAATPAHDPRIEVRGGVALFELVTTPWAIGDVGELLVERREQQALRDLPRHWFDEVGGRINAHATDPLASVHAELLALALPGHPETDAARRPGRAVPRRAQARAVWEATQHPTRTIHVLLGGMDVDQVKSVLERTFRTTRLPPPEVTPLPTPPPLRGMRRSTVPGTGRSLVAMAWVLPPIPDLDLLEVATLWLSDGKQSRLARELRRRGHPNVTVRGTAPWPPVPGGRSLLRIEIEHAPGVEGIADLVIEICGEVAESAPPKPRLARQLAVIRRNWGAVTAEPRWLASEIARHSLLSPNAPVHLAPPRQPDPAATQKLLRQIFGNHPVVVEATP